ncbi:hypothetical protein D3C86_2212820 [compost metagenome]
MIKGSVIKGRTRSIFRFFDSLTDIVFVSIVQLFVSLIGFTLEITDVFLIEEVSPETTVQIL